jgi:hypothetical protein
MMPSEERFWFMERCPSSQPEEPEQKPVLECKACLYSIVKYLSRSRTERDAASPARVRHRIEG